MILLGFTTISYLYKLAEECFGQTCFCVNGLVTMHLIFMFYTTLTIKKAFIICFYFWGNYDKIFNSSELLFVACSDGHVKKLGNHTALLQIIAGYQLSPDRIQMDITSLK